MSKTFFTNDYAKKIAMQWEKFQENGDVEGVRPLIAESWKRCRSRNVDIDRIEHPALAKEEFNDVLQKNATFVEVSSLILERIFKTVRSLECIINLANADGIALRHWQGKESSFKMDAGTRILEECIGTAGMPLCLAEREPVIVFCAEHYCRPQHNVVCVSSPIIAYTGKLLGGITLSCNRELFHPWSFTLVSEAAKSIVEQLRLRSMLATETTLIEAFNDGVLLLDEDGGILRINGAARKILSLGNKNPPRIDNIFADHPIKKAICQGRGFRNEECRLILGGGQSARCIASFNPVHPGGVITLKNTPEMYSYAAITAGTEARYIFSDIVGESSILKECLERARSYATEDLTVLITGESGVGKELFAQAIHNASPRRNQPFVVVNCGALPRELVQSELFGYAEGAFTGARRNGNPGKFELAENGTIFLDEIGEMELESQTSLLRLLQDGEVTRIGGRFAKKLNVRVITATNRDLRKAIAEGRFREDLYYRLNVFSLHIPALRERREDIGLLANHFMANLIRKHPYLMPRYLSGEALDALIGRSWGGNARELEHFIEKLMFTVKNEVIGLKDVMEEGAAHYGGEAGIMAVSHKNSDREAIIQALTLSNGNMGKAAKLLGLGRTTLYTRVNMLGLSPKQYKKLRVLCQDPDCV